ncbi:MAG: hypothetical protein ACNA7J_07800 [Wenzhouxiangella sp.]
MRTILIILTASAALALSGAISAQPGPPAHAGGPPDSRPVQFHSVELGCELVDLVYGTLDPDTLMDDPEIELEDSLARNPWTGSNCTEINGYANLAVRSDESFTVQFVAGGLAPGNAVTLWAFDATFAGGFLAGGVVGGSGTVNLAGNNCIYIMEPDEDGFMAPDVGFEPGGDRACDKINLGASLPQFLPPGLNLWLLDHGPWTPGDTAAIWTWEGLPGGNTAAWFILD